MARARWVRLDVEYFRHPRPRAAGRDGRDLHLASICWVAAQLTDGHIPADCVGVILSDAGVKRPAVDRAVAAGLWVPNGDGFDIRDYLDRNPSRDSVQHERDVWRTRQQRKRSRDEDGKYAGDDS